MRNMSFSMTTPQILERSKTVTRRLGWWNLKEGQHVRAVKKAMGLKKGEKIQPLTEIEIVSVRSEPLNVITQDDVIKEGFPDFTPQDFIDMICKHYKVKPDVIVNRIEFKYL